MIHMTATVIPHGCADILRDAIEIAQQFLDRESLKIGLAVQRLIQVRDISAVMLVVVNLHGHFVDVRLESVRWIGKRRKNMGHVTLLG